MTPAAFLEILGTLQSSPDWRSASELGLEALKACLSADLYCINYFRHQNPDGPDIFMAGLGWVVDSAHPLRRQFNEFASVAKSRDQHPALQAGEKTPSPTAVVRSGQIDDTAWRKTPFYQIVDRPNRIGDVASILVPSSGGLLAINCCRTGRFDHRQSLKTIRLVSSLIGPWLKACLEPGGKSQTLPYCDQLSSRENEILACVEQGMSNLQIANSLAITFGTVRKHMENIFRKLGVQNRTGAVRLVRSGNHGQKPSDLAPPDRLR